MPSTKPFLMSVLDALALAEDVTARPMMGEYILYYRGKVIGGVYDDRLLLKPTPTAKRLLSDAPLAIPYPGAKAMLHVERPDPGLLREVLQGMYAELPDRKR